MQHTATYGDFRSPIRANFQNVPSALQQNNRDTKLIQAIEIKPIEIIYTINTFEICLGLPGFVAVN